LLALDESDPKRSVTGIQDFYSLSECRDLLFHVQETCYTLAEIREMLDSAGLEFIGFEFMDPAVRKRYRSRYAADVSLANLDNWQRFEQEFPDTFIEMYNFWCRKPGIL